MKLKVFDIPEDGMNVTASSTAGAQDAWFERVVEEAFQGDFPKGGRAQLDLHILRTSDNVQISGVAEIDLKPTCDRCLESFQKRVSVPLHVNLVPRQAPDFELGEEEGTNEGLDEGLDEDDVAFSFYQGEQIDLSAIICEMLVLDIPLRYLCTESCKGLCPQCGQNLNTGTCACSKTPVDPRLAVLKQLLKDQS